MLRKGRGPTKETFKQVIPGGPTYSLGDCMDQKGQISLAGSSWGKFKYVS